MYNTSCDSDHKENSRPISYIFPTKPSSRRHFGGCSVFCILSHISHIVGCLLWEWAWVGIGQPRRSILVFPCGTFWCGLFNISRFVGFLRMFHRFLKSQQLFCRQLSLREPFGLRLQRCFVYVPSLSELVLSSNFKRAPMPPSTNCTNRWD